MKTNKKLKKEYKQLKPIMGVFQVKNKANKKVLIEGSTNINARWNRHQTELKLGSHRNKELQKDWKKLGEENFVYSILSTLEVEDGDSLDIKKEVKLLEEMVLEELGMDDDKRY